MRPREFSFILIAVCILAVWQVFEIPSSPMYAVVGATLVPTVIVFLLGFCSIIYLIQASRGRARDCSLDEKEEPLSGGIQRFFYFFLAGAILTLGVGWLGFIATASLAGYGVARAFDAPSSWKSLSVCFLISVFFWLLFDRVLSVDLGPAFPFSNLFKTS